MSGSLTKPSDQRSVPRIENMDCAMRCRMGERDEVTMLRLRDLSTDSICLETHETSVPSLRDKEITHLEASIPELGLYLQCKAQLARSFDSGMALKFMNLDPTTRGIIRSFYPPGTEWQQDAAR